VVLTADRTLTADYRLLFDGILAASQTTTTPSPILRAFLLPRARRGQMRGQVAPLGLRRVEAALLDGGFGAHEVAVADQDHLAQVIGRGTRAVGVSTGEPTGIGMSTTTVRAIAGGKAYPSVMFSSLMKDVRSAVEASGAGAKVVAGGPGAWQLVRRPDRRRELGIDHVITGYAEGNVADVFRALSQGDSLPEVISGEGVPASEIPRIRGASTMGVVEISRGCGLGCSFCTIAHTPMEHLPEATIVADVETNLAAGLNDICVISEDLFRYGAEGLQARPQALISLLSRLRGIDGLGIIQTDHGNIVSVSQYSDDELAEVRNLLVGSTGQQHPWVNLGVETASGALLEANGCAPKMGLYSAAEWADACTTQLKRLCRAGFCPMASIVVGLPGETQEDIRRTVAWVRSMSDENLSIFPLIYAPINGTPPPTARSLSRLQWQLIRTCYRLNFKRIPRMYWDSQRAARVGLARRCLMQVLGRGQALLWKVLLAWRSRRGRDAGAD